MPTLPKHIRYSTISLLGIYMMILGLLAIHPWHEDEAHHSDHICVEARHYHKAPEVCELCDITLTPAYHSGCYRIEQVYPIEWVIPYLRLSANTFSSNDYSYLLRGPPYA